MQSILTHIRTFLSGPLPHETAETLNELIVDVEAVVSDMEIAVSCWLGVGDILNELRTIRVDVRQNENCLTPSQRLRVDELRRVFHETIGSVR